MEKLGVGTTALPVPEWTGLIRHMDCKGHTAVSLRDNDSLEICPIQNPGTTIHPTSTDTCVHITCVFIFHGIYTPNDS
jgi:hypothetical protein